jgi:hypothetical protein
MHSPRALRRRLAAAALLGASMAGCRVLTAPERPTGSIALERPAVYARWWAMTEACAGVRAPLGDIDFYEVPGIASFSIEGHSDVVGYWTAGGNQIVMAGDFVLDGGAVRHEMLHAITRAPGHPPHQFLGRCAGIVDCGPSCVKDAGPLPPAEGATVGSGTLQVRVSLDPAEPRSGVDDGHFSVIVSATNPAPNPVVVALDGGLTPRTFLYEVRGPAAVQGGTLAWSEASLRFGPGETKRQVFDFSIGNAPFERKIPPGAYTVRGAFGIRNSPTVGVQVGP